jgi:hypothetical protein
MLWNGLAYNKHSAYILQMFSTKIDSRSQSYETFFEINLSSRF